MRCQVAGVRRNYCAAVSAAGKRPSLQPDSSGFWPKAIVGPAFTPGCALSAPARLNTNWARRPLTGVLAVELQPLVGSVVTGRTRPVNGPGVERKLVGRIASPDVNVGPNTAAPARPVNGPRIFHPVVPYCSYQTTAHDRVLFIISTTAAMLRNHRTI